jgi:hypothetical protein
MLYIIAGISVAALLGIVVLGVALGYDLVELTFHPPIFVKLKLTRTNRHLVSPTPWLDRTRPWYTRLAIMANPARRRSPTWSPPPAGTTFFPPPDDARLSHRLTGNVTWHHDPI